MPRWSGESPKWKEVEMKNWSHVLNQDALLSPVAVKLHKIPA